jgi:VWFA-related protein
MPYPRAFVRPVVVCGLLAAGAASSLAQTPQPSPSVVFPADVELVTVDVLVLDKHGKPVEGLKRDDFSVKEDGKPQSIIAFEAVSVPESAPTPVRTRVSTNTIPRPAVERTFVIVFDDANITQYSTAHARKAISDFIKQGLRPGDEVMVVPTTGGAWWTGRLPQDQESLLAYVGKLEGHYRPEAGVGRIWDHEAMAIWLGRDPKMLSYVARRWFENNLMPESYPTDDEVRNALDVSPGLALIRAKAGETYRAAVGRIRLTLDTLSRVAEALAPIRGRKNLLMVSEGFIMDTSQPEFREVVRAARRSNAAVHFLDARSAEGALGQSGMPGGNAEYGRDVEEQDSTTLIALASQSVEGSRSVALDTGGSIVPATNGLANAMTKIADESRAYYLIGFNSSNAKRDGGYRKLSVQVARDDVDVRARRGYYAPKDGEQRKPDPDKLDPKVRAGLDAPVTADGVPLRLTSYVVGAPGPKTPVMLVAEADVAPLNLAPKDGKVAAAFDTYVVVHGRDSGQLYKQEKLLEMDVPEQYWPQLKQTGVAIRRDFELPPGAYQARLLVRDKASGRLGTVLHEFDVPAAKGLRTSTPIFTDVFQQAPGSELPRPVPVAHRTFRAGARLGWAYEVFGAQPDAAAGGPKVSASYVVRKADGTVVSNGPSRPLKAAGLSQLTQVLVFPAPAEAGDYEFALEVRDEAGGVATQVVEPFTVGP